MKPSELLAKEENWTKGTAARDKSNNPVGIHSPEAFSFCAYGALQKCGVNEDGIDLLYSKVPVGSLVSFNDNSNTTHTEIIALLKSVNL